MFSDRNGFFDAGRGFFRERNLAIGRLFDPVAPGLVLSEYNLAVRASFFAIRSLANQEFNQIKYRSFHN